MEYEIGKILDDSMPDDEMVVCMVQDLTDSLNDPAEKSAESANDRVCVEELSKRQKQILYCMQAGKSYSTEEIAHKVGLKVPGQGSY